ncbi:D-alanyl-D-alanine carboxypeptidase/D-alanyl-D-alanine-endopeptidase [Suttonella sp. R2A3]|uniref:D-alanyl-D-alanine carboxypeptidase/D-alanyl-D-alanine endopeptidase n=1 Tax=Suttonella sp. R2A3 TaxID=2908648 RepID=UPI001F1E2818|nr:D-alanyl-D-alanine carboxypeptidase/D-alanyl-D-alanine-endopeptidase [Suttonella sp. R2A3]UJF25337.1 D-alanyl-D-alanine carboxypeptidase/D-alanyl-D-alanine-endopeptidase [Suttonella sp. R2A3]
MRWFFAIMLWFVMLVGRAETLPAAVNNLLNEYNVPRDEVSVWVQAVDGSDPLVELNGYAQRNPASVAKLLTTSAGLIRLGEDYRWQTRFYVDQMPDAQGVLHGNLYVVGGGDPFLVEERLEQIIRDLQAKGIKRITGNIVLDESLYVLDAQARDRESFDGNPWAAYNAVPSPLMVNFRTVKITMRPQGNNVVFDVWPTMANWQVENQMSVNSGACSKNYAPSVAIEREGGYATVVLKGRYSVACGERELTVVMGEASEQFYYLFRELWYQNGGQLDGTGAIAQRPASAKLFYSGESLPLSEQITKMNQLSNNVMTRQLMLTLGAEVYGAPGSLQKGRDAVVDTLSVFGVPTEGMIIDNGAGLSRVTRTTAAQLVMLLRSLYYSGKGEVFMDSLSVAGENGTLKRRFRGESLQGRVIGKTGTLDRVRAFAGYVRARSGRDYVVVIIGNGRAALPSRYMQDDLIRWVDEQ